MPSLRALARAHDVALVVTRPDAPKGRGLKLTPSPVRSAARALSLTVETPARLDAAFVERVTGLRVDVLACASYGRILPAALLAAPARAALNVHPSLLPVYRGATPIQSALRDGATRTGVTIFWMTSAMDAGDIALARGAPIGVDDDYGSLHDRLASVGADLLVEALDRLARGELARTPQDDARATYTRPLHKDDLRLTFDRPASAVVDHVRSLAPRPGAWCEVRGARVKVLRARAEPALGDGAPGAVLTLDGDGPLLAARDGAVRLLRVVPAGKPEMAGADFARSLRA